MIHQNATPCRDSAALREEVIRACFFMRDRLGYFVGTWGNISVRLEDGLLVTRPAILTDEVYIDQHWAFGDAVVEVPGYDVKILPTSGVISEAVLWMVCAEAFAAPDPNVSPGR